MRYSVKVGLVLTILVLMSATIIVYDYIQPISAVRIAYLHGDLHHLSLFVAVEKGFLREEGIDFELSRYSSGVEEMVAFAAGAVDVGYLGIAPASLKRVNEHIMVTIISAANIEGSVLVAREGIDEVADLLDKRVAYPGPGTVQDILLRIALQKNHLGYGNLTGGAPIKMGPWDMDAALSADEIDAFIAWEPYCTRSILNENGHAVATSHEIWSGHPCCVLAVKNEYLEKNPSLVRKIVRAHVRATKWIFDHPDEAADIAKKYTGLDLEVVKSAMGNLKFIYQPDIEGIKKYIEYLIKFGYIKEEEKPENIDSFIQQFVNTEFIEGS